MPALMAFLAGLLFSVGLGVGGMTHPQKVIGFLDVAGAWDPSLMFVMMGALIVFGTGYRLVIRRARPVFGERFMIPAKKAVSMRLIGGAIVFGVGWGASGFCPGPAIVNLAGGLVPVWVFAATMGVGLYLGNKAAGSPGMESLKGPVS